MDDNKKLLDFMEERFPGFKEIVEEEQRLLNERFPKKEDRVRWALSHFIAAEQIDLALNDD